MNFKNACGMVFLFLFCCLGMDLQSEQLYLRNNLKRAQPGDYIVSVQNKTYSLLSIREKQGDLLTIEEISIPTGKLPQNNFSWKSWVKNGAPNNTSWVAYTIDLQTAQMREYYSYTKNGWYDVPDRDNFLTTLLNLRLDKIPAKERKRIGFTFSGNERRGLWQPRMFVDGQEVKDVSFAAWKTYWPKDNSELSGKLIEVYVPEDGERYPSYFPYWLQISGIVGQAKVRIIDSGSQLSSPAQSLNQLRKQ